MKQNPEMEMNAPKEMIQEVCVVCGHKCHCGTTCEEPGCNCGVCTHEVEEVEDYLHITSEG